MRTKHQTPAQRVANPVWLRRQLGQLVRDCAANIERNQKLADTACDAERRKVHLDRIKDFAVSALERRHLAIAAVQFVVCAAIDLGEDQTAIRNLEHRLLATITKHTSEATKI